MEIIALNLLRFNDLAEAFGGDIGRWPVAERASALALITADPTGTKPILTEAAALDALLAVSPDTVPSLALRNAVVGSAPRPQRAVSSRRWAGVGLGASLAAASVAGVLAGAAAAPIAVSHSRQTADTTGEAARWLGEPNDLSEG